MFRDDSLEERRPAQVAEELDPRTVDPGEAAIAVDDVGRSRKISDRSRKIERKKIGCRRLGFSHNESSEHKGLSAAPTRATDRQVARTERGTVDPPRRPRGRRCGHTCRPVRGVELVIRPYLLS